MSSLSKDEEASALAWLRRLTSEDAQAIGYELATKYGVNISPAELEATFLAIRARLTKPNQREEALTEEEKARPGRPVLPDFDGIPGIVLEAMCKADGEAVNQYAAIKAMLDVLRAHLTKPKTREVDVWYVQYTHYGSPSVAVADSKVAADERSVTLIEDGCECVRITGPHKQEVPYG